MTTALERASKAVQDATAGEMSEEQNLRIARAVLLAVRETDQEIMDAAFSDALEHVYPGDFARVIDAILNEPNK